MLYIEVQINLHVLCITKKYDIYLLVYILICVMNFLFTIGRIMKIFEKIIVNHISPKDTKLDPRIPIDNTVEVLCGHNILQLLSNNQLILSRGKQHIFL